MRDLRGLPNDVQTASSSSERGSAVPSDLAGKPGANTVRCSCGAQVQASGRGQCPRCGRFLAGNEVALVHGVRQLQERQRHGWSSPLDDARRREILGAVLADLGGPEECSTVLREIVADFAAAVVLRDTAFGHLAVVGPLTRAGRRRAVVDLYLQASQRAERLANQIGTSATTRFSCR